MSTDSENVQRVENEEDSVVDEAYQECPQHYVRPAAIQYTHPRKYVYTTNCIHVLFVSCCLATKISKANFRPREGCGLLESSPMMKRDQRLTN